jgi:glycosyltransferase involved in cell wall biosynthesis
VAEEVVAELGVDRERVRAVHHGTPRSLRPPENSSSGTPSTSSPLSPSSPLSGGLPEGTDRYVLAIGTAEPRKDLPSLVRAFDSIASRHPDVALVFAGPPGWGSAALSDAISRSRNGARIVVTGYVADLDQLLRGAAVLAYPSLYEGFGLPTLEAMAAAVPVVTTTSGALPEVVGDAALMVAPGDPEALGAAIERLLSDEVERLALIERGIERASLFTWEACAEGLASLYEEAAEGRR